MRESGMRKYEKMWKIPGWKGSSPAVKKTSASKAAVKKEVWNKGREIGQKPPLNVQQITAIRVVLKEKGFLRDAALFDLAIDSMLLPCDLMKLSVENVSVEGHAKKTADCDRTRYKEAKYQFAIGTHAQSTLNLYLAQLPYLSGGFLFPGLKGQPLGTRQYARLAMEWFVWAGLDPLVYSGHSIRRAKPFVVYEKTNNIYAVKKLLGHRMIKNTIHYLGLDNPGGVNIAVEVDI